MRITSFASGSRANATLVESSGEAILVDCGVSYRTLKRHLPARLSGILVTHSHTDHVSGLRTLLQHVDAPVFANALTAEATAWQEKLSPEAFALFENGQTFEVGPFEVAPFSIPHDTSDPVGFLVRADGLVYFHATDVGTPLDSVGLKLAEADVATLESNHDAVMLRTSRRPPSLIQRIAGPRGHLSNDQADDLVRRFASPRLKALALAHLSRECNAPHLAEGAMKATLLGMGRGDVALKVLSQDETVVIWEGAPLP